MATKTYLALVGLLSLIAVPSCAPPQTSSGDNLKPLSEGQGVHHLSMPADIGQQRIVWFPPYYAVAGRQAGLGRLGQGLQPLGSAYAGLTDASWSSDGRRIALVVTSGSGTSNDVSTTIFVNATGTYDFHELTSNLNMGTVDMAPDGGYLVTTSSPSLGRYDHTLYDLSDQASTSLGLGDDTQTTGGRVVWSHDSTKVAYLMPKHQLYLTAIASASVQHSATSASEALGWSGDNSQFYTFDPSGPRVIVQPLSGASHSIDLHLPSNTSGEVTNLHLSPDGQKLAFNVQALEPVGVYVANLQDGVARQVVPPSVLQGWEDNGTLICTVDSDAYSIDLSQR